MDSLEDRPAPPPPASDCHPRLSSLDRRLTSRLRAILTRSLAVAFLALTGCSEGPSTTAQAAEPVTSDSGRYADGDGVDTASPLGFSPGAEFRMLDDVHLADDLAAMQSVGARWIRLDVDWSVIERDEDEFDWVATDRVVEAAIAHDLDVLAMVAYTPNWARGQENTDENTQENTQENTEGTTDKSPPVDNDRFARFVSEAVSRYEPMGVRAWQIWNEPNSPLFWASGADPEHYGKMLSAGTAAIRSVDPDATIVSAGLAPAEDQPDDGWLSPETYLRRLLDTGALSDVDAVGIHPYSFPARPLDEDTKEWNTFARLPAIRDLLAASDNGPHVIWITEYGAPTGDHDRSVSAEDQAVLVTDAFQAAQAWDWVGPIFVYTLRDYRDAPGELEWNYGILAHDGSPKPAWFELLERHD